MEEDNFRLLYNDQKDFLKDTLEIFELGLYKKLLRSFQHALMLLSICLW